jgi:hypothetical protein
MTLLVGLVTWALVTFGMTYLATRAEITEPIRIRIVAFVPFMVLLLSCRACTAFWTGQAAAAATMGIAYGLGCTVPWHSWLYLPPTAGVAAIGLVDIIAFARHYGGGDAGA